MIVVTIELWPKGDSTHKRVLGKAVIVNDCTGNKDNGNYDIKLMKSFEYSRNHGIWKHGKVTGFDKVKLGPYDLLYRALKACVGNRK